MKFLPDINVWLALTFSGHLHHERAVAWFSEIPPGSCAFCRMTQQGFLRLSSNPRVFLTDALPLPLAWQVYDALQSDERTYFSAEPPGVEETWRQFTDDADFSPKIWNDAFLAAFAKVAGSQLVTFDRGFNRYAGLKAQILTG